MPAIMHCLMADLSQAMPLELSSDGPVTVWRYMLLRVTSSVPHAIRRGPRLVVWQLAMSLAACCRAEISSCIAAMVPGVEGM